MTGTAAQWDDIYATRAVDEVSWFQRRPAVSLRLLGAVTTPASAVIDVGAGASYLADALLDDGWSDVTLLDVSDRALAAVRERLGPRPGVRFVVADALGWTPPRRYDVWHDRAVFHFLVTPDARSAYVATARAAVRRGGFVVIGTFAVDGPSECSGLPAARYDAAALAAQFGDAFTLECAEREEHVTPRGVVQPFTWAVLHRR